MLHTAVHSHQPQGPGKSLRAGESWHEWMGHIVQWQQTHLANTAAAQASESSCTV